MHLALDRKAICIKAVFSVEVTVVVVVMIAARLFFYSLLLLRGGRVSSHQFYVTPPPEQRTSSSGGMCPRLNTSRKRFLGCRDRCDAIKQIGIKHYRDSLQIAVLFDSCRSGGHRRFGRRCVGLGVVASRTKPSVTVQRDRRQRNVRGRTQSGRISQRLGLQKLARRVVCRGI